MMDLNGESSPCRWAAMFNDDGSDSDTQLTDLSPREQIARGQQLLKLLWEPVTPREVTQPKQVTELPSAAANEFHEPRSLSSELKVHVKNTFVELDKSPCRRSLQRSQSDSALLSGSLRCADECDASVSFGVPESKTEKTSNVTLAADQSESQCKVVKPQVLTLSTCLSDGQWRESTDRCVELSDASTDTPRDSVEDLSIHEAFDAVLAGELMPEDDDACAHHTIAMGCGYHQADAYYYPQFDSVCISTQQQDATASQPHNFHRASVRALGEYRPEDAAAGKPHNFHHASMRALGEYLPEARVYDSFDASWTQGPMQGDVAVSGTECMNLGSTLCHNEVQDEYMPLGRGCMPAQQQLPCTVMSFGASCGGSLMPISCPNTGTVGAPSSTLTTQWQWPAPVLWGQS